MILKPFAAQTNGVMLATDGRLPLNAADMNRLLALVPEGESIYLTLKDGLNMEYVLAENTCGVMVVSRGQQGSEPKWFPNGTCVFFENSIAVTRWIMCNEDCCDGECPCNGVAVAGKVVPVGVVGDLYEASVVLSGDLPMVLGVSANLPPWAEVEAGPNYVRIHGTPTSSGSWTFAVSATNCSGQNLDTEDVTVGVI